MRQFFKFLRFLRLRLSFVTINDCLCHRFTLSAQEAHFTYHIVSKYIFVKNLSNTELLLNKMHSFKLVGKIRLSIQISFSRCACVYAVPKCSDVAWEDKSHKWEPCIKMFKKRDWKISLFNNQRLYCGRMRKCKKFVTCKGRREFDKIKKYFPISLF